MFYLRDFYLVNDSCLFINHQPSTLIIPTGFPSGAYYLYFQRWTAWLKPVRAYTVRVYSKGTV